MDRGAWWATVQRVVTKSGTVLSTTASSAGWRLKAQILKPYDLSLETSETAA